MKIIICGGGQVGVGIARQLAGEGNDVTIIDPNPEIIQKINDTLDVSAIRGVPSHPPILESAGAADAEMIIAVTLSDEINMVVSQVAHSLFNIPVKIARIRHQNYLNPIWKDMYRQDHLPIDYIISPEKEVADAIINRLHVPGAMDSIPFGGERMNVVEVRCMDNCPLLNEPINHIYERFDNLRVSILGILRREMLIVPDPTEKIRAGDEIFFVADSQHLSKVMPLFGHEEKEAHRVLIIGGGNIGLFIAKALENEDTDINAKVIELNTDRAEYIATKLEHTTVINGSSLDQEILFEANIESIDTVIAVTNGDEVNILSSLLCKQYGAKMAFALINNSRSYSSLVGSLGVDVVINPREMTVSTILQHIRKGKVRAAHSICGGVAEILEIEAVNNSAIVDRTIADLHLPRGVRIGAILRHDEVIVPDDKTTILVNDRIILLSITSQLAKVDRIFSAKIDYF